jgi:sortase A
VPVQRYVKSVAFHPQGVTVITARIPDSFWRILPNVFIVVGATALTTVAYPLVSYQLTAHKWQSQTLLSPIAEIQTAEAKGIVIPVADSAVPSVLAAQTQEPEIVSGVDFTKASNWFPNAPAQAVKPSKITHYRISIPKLKIDQATVEIGGDNLNHALIHYGGTAAPGEYGNAVVFGHSILPVFYNPKDYRSIFSLLPTLEKGDEIFIDYDGIQYKYVVDSYTEVKPEDIEILEQRFDRQALTLVTCVPPGTYLRRGIIRAYLDKL